MQDKPLIKLLEKTLINHKANNIEILHVQELTSMTDTFIIASGNSNQHNKSLAQKILLAAKQKNLVPLKTEGLSLGEWILIDLGGIIIHIMLPRTRDFYLLEKLWSSKFTNTA